MKQTCTNKNNQPKARLGISKYLALAVFSLCTLLNTASAEPWIKVPLPNGFARIKNFDLSEQSTAGSVYWFREWDGREWKFNSQWESLSQSWTNLTGSQSADSSNNIAGSTINTGISQASTNCSISADEDWQPNISSGVVDPMLPLRSTPFNLSMGNAADVYPSSKKIVLDTSALCVGNASHNISAEGVRRIDNLYYGNNGRFSYDNSNSLQKTAVLQLPSSLDAATLDAELNTGKITINPQSNSKGWHWLNKSGEWMNYNSAGQVVAYGDKNNNSIWLLRDKTGILRGVVAANGQVLFHLFYNNAGLISQVEDYPVAGLIGDLPSRSIKYQYDARNRLTTITDALGNTTNYAYDNLNHITKITDAENHTESLNYQDQLVIKRTAPDGGVTDFSFSYDNANKQYNSRITRPQTATGRLIENYTHNKVGQLIRKQVNGLTTTEVAYNTAARTEITRDVRGKITQLAKNEFGQVVQQIDANGGVRKYSYSALNLRPTEIIDQLGNKTEYQYDAKGNLIQQINAAGSNAARSIKYQVNSLGQTSKITQVGKTEADGSITPDAVWQLSYDALGQIKQITYPDGNSRYFVYNRAGDLIKTTDALGNSTNYSVDANSNLIKITDALGRSFNYSYDKVGNLISATDAKGKSIKASYDAMNRLLQTSDQLNNSTTNQYDAEGDLISATDAENHSNKFDYNAYLQLAKQTDALANTTQFDYSNSAGNLEESPTKIKYPTFDLQNQFDNNGQTLSTTLNNPSADNTSSKSSTIKRTYDAKGRVKTISDAYGKNKTFTYNALGQVVSVTDALGKTNSVKYDARGNVIQSIDDKGDITKFAYDKNNRLIAETLPLGQTTKYSYNANGNLIARVDAIGNKLTYAYDAVYRLIELKQYNANNILTRDSNFQYDNNNNLTSWSDTDKLSNQTTKASLSYDAANRKISEAIQFPTPSGSKTLSYAYKYDKNGQKTALTWADGTQIKYAYNANGYLTSVDIPNQGIISINEFKWSAPTKITLPGNNTVSNNYDGLLLPTSSQVKTANQQTTLNLQNTWGLNLELNKNQRTDNVNGKSSSKDSDFSYDDNQRLIQVKTDTGGLFGTNTESFTLDGIANRTKHNSESWTYNANSQLLQQGSTNYQYDDNGNTTQKNENGKITHYAYDTLNRLIQVSDSNNNLIAKYGYDVFNRRIWKEQYKDLNGADLTQAIRTIYLYADEGLIAEATQNIKLNADNSITASTSPIISSQYGIKPDNPFGTGVLFIKSKDKNQQETFAYYQHDQLGTPIQAIDKAGKVVWAADYNAFGQATITANDITSNLRLPGQYFDAETALHYNWNRYYNPEMGRYITSDPIGLAGGMNRYAYVLGNPTGLMDPMGLWWWGDPLPQGLVDFSAGFGDTISFGLTNWIRDKMGTNDAVNKCSGYYTAGEVAGVAVDMAIGGAAGWEAAGVKGAGKEFSHWIPKRLIPKRMGELRSKWNGNYVTKVEHALSDRYRYRFMPKAWKEAPGNSMPNMAQQQWVRLPKVYKGAAAGVAYGTGGAAMSSDCTCQK